MLIAVSTPHGPPSARWLVVVSTARIGRPPFYRGGPASTETTPATSPPLPLCSALLLSSSRVGWSVLDCARRTSTFLLCAFREQEDDQATLPSPCSSALRPVHSTCAIQPGLASMIHEHFCCNRRSAVPTSLRPAGSPLRPSTYCTSTPQVLRAPRAGLTTRLRDFATNCHESCGLNSPARSFISRLLIVSCRL
jgi:hypothetical protein